jgi:cyclophilin family peptidyl-prolyl cis-trans isomerase
MLGALLTLGSCGSEDNPCTPTNVVNNPIVVIETSLGEITVELYPLEAPITVGNFLRYAHEGFYDSLTFHRVIKQFMIQGGGFDENLIKKPVYEPIPSEASNGLSNVQGTISMARTADPHSATSQFFINAVDNLFLNFREETPFGWGYCVFGKVINGMDVVHDIESVETANRDGFSDVPVEPVVIVKLYRKH